jgi:hypothetical protein
MRSFGELDHETLARAGELPAFAVDEHLGIDRLHANR